MDYLHVQTDNPWYNYYIIIFTHYLFLLYSNCLHTPFYSSFPLLHFTLLYSSSLLFFIFIYNFITISSESKALKNKFLHGNINVIFQCWVLQEIVCIRVNLQCTTEHLIVKSHFEKKYWKLCRLSAYLFLIYRFYYLCTIKSFHLIWFNNGLSETIFTKRCSEHSL